MISECAAGGLKEAAGCFLKNPMRRNGEDNDRTRGKDVRTEKSDMEGLIWDISGGSGDQCDRYMCTDIQAETGGG